VIAELNRFIKSGRGQAMLEFALVLPILLFLVMGIIEFGRIFSAYLTITELAREGARYGVVGNTDASIKTLIKNRATAITLTDGDITITPQDPANPRKRGNSLQVSIDLLGGHRGPAYSRTHSRSLSSDCVVHHALRVG